MKSLNFINEIYSILFYAILIIFIFGYKLVKYPVFLKVLIILPLIFLIFLSLRLLKDRKWIDLVFLVSYILIAGFLLYLLIFDSQDLYNGAILPIIFSFSIVGLILNSIIFFKKEKEENLYVPI